MKVFGSPRLKTQETKKDTRPYNDGYPKNIREPIKKEELDATKDKESRKKSLISSNGKDHRLKETTESN